MIKQKQQVIKLWSEEVVMVRRILKEISDEAVEREGRKEELENEMEVMIKAIEGEQKPQKKGKNSPGERSARRRKYKIGRRKIEDKKE